MSPQEPVYHPACYEITHRLRPGATRTSTARVAMNRLRYTAPTSATKVVYCAVCGRPMMRGSRYTSPSLMGAWQHLRRDAAD